MTKLTKPSTINKIVFNYGTKKDNLSSSIVSSGAKWSVNLSGLQSGTLYYYQPIVEYEGGDKPIYGDIMPFKTYYGTLEYQGDAYYTTLLDNVEFMAENLRATSFNDGTQIPLMTAMTEWASAEGPAQCVAYNKDEYLKDLGRLYNGYAMQTDKVCPEGWRLPKYSDLLKEEFGNYLSGEQLGTGSLFLSDNKYWANPVFCSNELSLSLLPSGCRLDTPQWGSEDGFYGEHWQLYFWALDENNSNSLNAFNGILQLGVEGYIGKYNLYNAGKSRTGYSVRCVRDK